MRSMCAIAAIASVVFFSSCAKTNSDQQRISQAFLDSLTEKQIGDLNYTIQIPSDYILEEDRGPDFSVFYFIPADTSTTNKISGGIYLGNHPSKFSPSGDSCKTETVQGQILSQTASWTIYQCNGDFLMQTITNTRSNQGWDSQIHAFGHGTGETQRLKLLKIYSTLKKKS